MLELAVTDLGVIDRLTLLPGSGMTALTGETGAGKTLVVTAIELLVGGRADPGLVRPGRSEAIVEGRFLHDGEEMVLKRVIPADGRSRAYVGGSLATASDLAAIGSELVDLHGQHAHQSLLAAAAQRSALDRYGDIDLDPLRDVRRAVGELDEQLRALGGDERERARELDLLRFQVAELEAAALHPGELVGLEQEESVLADASGHREAAARALDALAGEDGAEGWLREAVAALAGRRAFEALEARLLGMALEVGDLAAELREAGEAIPDDPERAEIVHSRLTLLRDLLRKYGDSIEDVLSYEEEARTRLADLEARDERVEALEADRVRLGAEHQRFAAAVAGARREAAPLLAAEAIGHLRMLALPGAEIAVEVDGADPCDDVRFLFAADSGSPLRPLAKVASGGELARVMLALRLVLTSGPDTLVFDEVDAGVGGEAALAVGRALAELGSEHQVLVVTHLPQVAAFADRQVAVSKITDEGSAVTRAVALDEIDRIVELSRMLSGTPSSTAAQDHAVELLAAATAERGR